MHIFGQKEGTRNQLTVPQAIALILENQYHQRKLFKELSDTLDVINENIYDLKKELEKSNTIAKHEKMFLKNEDQSKN